RGAHLFAHNREAVSVCERRDLDGMRTAFLHLTSCRRHPRQIAEVVDDVDRLAELTGEGKPLHRRGTCPLPLPSPDAVPADLRERAGKARRPLCLCDTNGFGTDSIPLARAIEHAEDDRLERQRPPLTRVWYPAEPAERSLIEDGRLLGTTCTRVCTPEPVLSVNVDKRTVARSELAGTLGSVNSFFYVTEEVARLDSVPDPDGRARTVFGL